MVDQLILKRVCRLMSKKRRQVRMKVQLVPQRARTGLLYFLLTVYLNHSLKIQTEGSEDGSSGVLSLTRISEAVQHTDTLFNRTSDPCNLFF